MRTHTTLIATAATLVALAVAGCGSNGTSTAGTSPRAGGPDTVVSTPGTASTSPGTTPGTTPGTAVAATGMYAKRYCEVLLVSGITGNARAEVYNSYPLNDCPAAEWQALDARAIAAREAVPVAVLNGPRYWLMDRVDKTGGAPRTKKDFGGIEMYRQASVVLGNLTDAARPYTPHDVDRSTVFTFNTGRTVHELTAPDGRIYVMQTWSQQVDPTLTDTGLADLTHRLTLPAGWTYNSRVLNAPLLVDTTTAAAKVLQDDLKNSYSLEQPTP